MSSYDPKKVEKKWQKRWEDSQDFAATEDTSKPKYYVLDMFPYPSGAGIHLGHTENYTATDIYSRYKRAQGFNVLYPMGWDAFGLPAENYAIKTGIPPAKTTNNAINNFRKQIKSLGLSYAWSREIGTHTPEYYRWTQWLFLKFFEKGLAYKKKALVNWDPVDQTVLANEQVLPDGTAERSGAKVEQKELEQWFFKITNYADELIDDLDKVDWPESTKINQRNWIGPSEGAEIEFPVARSNLSIEVFTTRPDTIFGATYLVLSPEYEKITSIKSQVSNWEEVEKYIAKAKRKTDIERTAEGKEKTGVEIKGVKAINPANSEEIPIFIADYVLASYGTGAIMAVPAHDERDREFADKFGLPISDAPLEDAKKITKKVGGTWLTNFKLRDWIFSRQRYWGEPIPMIFCEKDGWVPVPESELPVELPKVEKYQPTDTGESPLANIEEWVETTCPTCDGPAKRETDVMPNWAGSSWYYLRYCDPHNDKEFASRKKLEYWTPVDWYNGGMEHTVLHLLYSRFWHKFLYDIGVVPTSEPYLKRTSHGLILAEDGRKMSKSLGNVVSPDEIVERFGADSLRLYEMFLGPFDQPVAWSTASIAGVRRFLERVWKLQYRDFVSPEDLRSPNIDTLLHQTIQKVSDDILNLKMNTAVSSLMILLNKLEENKEVPKQAYKTFLQLLAPFAPHIAAELWEQMGENTTIYRSVWPEVDRSKLVSATVPVVVQVNGKVRATLELPADASREEALQAARSDQKVQRWLALGKELKAVYVPHKVINFVVEIV